VRESLGKFLSFRDDAIAQKKKAFTKYL